MPSSLLDLATPADTQQQARRTGEPGRTTADKGEGANASQRPALEDCDGV